MIIYYDIKNNRYNFARNILLNEGYFFAPEIRKSFIDKN